MNKKNIDYSLYLVTDRTLSKGRSLIEIVTAAVKGGATCVQLREKNCSTRDFIDHALSIKTYLTSQSIPLIINDRVDVALAIDADGIHLGQDDMPLSIAKKIAPSHMTLGCSVASIDEAINAVDAGADYLGVGPLFATPTKPDAGTPLGLAGLQAICKRVSIPIVAIGGLNSKNIHDIILNGANGVAVVSAIISADNPEREARHIQSIISGCNI